jgi:hypothetical protein
MSHVSDHPHFATLQKGLREGGQDTWFIQQLMPNAVKWNRHWHQVLQDAGGQLLGLELEHPTLKSFALIMADASTPGMYRAQYFDRNGLKAHMTWESPEKVLENLIMEGYCVVARGALEALSRTRSWAIGMYKVDLIRRLNAGELTFGKAELLLREFAMQLQ